MLSIDTDLLGRKTWLTNLHTDVLDTHLSLDILNHAHELADRCCAKLLSVAKTVGNTDIINRLFI